MKSLRIAVGVLIAGALLYLTVRNIHFHDAIGMLAGIDLSYLGMALAALAAAYSARILRWTIMLRAFDRTVRWRTAAGPFMASLALNNILPLRLGDVMRCFGFRRTLAVRPPRVLGTVLVERILDLITLLVFLVVILWQFRPSAGQDQYLVRSAWIVAAGLVPCVAAILYPRLPAALLMHARRLPFVRTMPVAHKVAFFGLRAIWSLKIVGTGRRAIPLLGLSLGAWLLEGLCYLLVVRALNGGPSWVGPFFAMVSGTLATLIPSTPGYVGTFDLFAKLGLVAFGEPPTRAAIEALTIHAVLWLPVTVIGLAHIGYAWGLAPALQLLARQAKRVEANAG
jgi:uncharacterized protein (TIRG00374 family)